MLKFTGNFTINEPTCFNWRRIVSAYPEATFPQFLNLNDVMLLSLLYLHIINQMNLRHIAVLTGFVKKQPPKMFWPYAFTIAFLVATILTHIINKPHKSNVNFIIS